MSKNNYFLLVYLFPIWLFGQNQYTVYDSISKEVIPYASIWKDNIIYTNADEKGNFIILAASSKSKYSISSLGYKTKYFDLIENKIYLKFDTINLKEIQILRPSFKKEIKFGSNKNKDILLVVAKNNIRMSEIGKIFYIKDSSIVFLNEINFNTFSLLDKCTVNIKIYSLDKYDYPNEVLNPEGLICTIKKGARITKIDLKQNPIKIPDNKFMVSIQILLIEENKNYREYNKELYQYEPCLFLKNNTNENDTRTMLENRKWEVSKNTDLNIQVKLTN